MELSISRANRFRDCPRNYFWHYIARLRPAQAPWLKFGSAIDSLLEVYDSYGLQAAIEAIKTYELTDYESAEATFMLTAYSKLESMPTATIKTNEGFVSGNHFKFNVKFTGDEVSDNTFNIIGEFDKLAKTEGIPKIVERKTTNDAIEPNSAYWKKLSLNPQICAYAWIGNKLFGSYPKIVYEVLRKPHGVARKPFIKEVKGNKLLPQEWLQALLEVVDAPPVTMVARHEFSVDEEAINNFISTHAEVHELIERYMVKSDVLTKKEIHQKYAWPINTNSCDNYGGCPYRADCEGKCSAEQMETLTVADSSRETSSASESKVSTGH